MVSSIKPTPDESAAVSLLVTDKPGPWAESIAAKLSRQGYSVNWTTLDQEIPANEWIVLLLDLDGPYLHDVSTEGFTALQKFFIKLTDNHRALWVTKMSQLSCEDPRFGLIFGLARTLRQEQMLDLSIFETASFDEQAADAFSSVLKKLMFSRKNLDAEPEYEFSYKDEVLVGRCHWGGSKNETFTQSQQGTARKLGVGSFGLIETLEWVPYEPCELPSASMEVDMHYVGLNFRVRLLPLNTLIFNVTQAAN